MTEQLFQAQLSWWMLLVGALGLLLASEIGFRIGRRENGEGISTKTEQSRLLVGALLGLLGLLLAFSVAMVESRFGARKALVLDEANAIETTYLRAEMMPDPHGEQVQSLLRKYVENRVGLDDPAELPRRIEKSDELIEALWVEALAVAELSPDSEITGLFVDSLNEVIDLHESRLTVALYQRLPTPILWMLYLVSVVALGVLGYSSGLVRWRSILPTTGLVIAVTAVVILIVELDNPAGQILRVNQRSMEDVHEFMVRGERA